jgi:hypothetical protein
MAKKPDGSAARTERVTFTKPAAERIAKVVRAVEAGDRDQFGLVFDHPMPVVRGKAFRVCTFTGAWSKNSAKTVTFKFGNNTPNTVNATNLFFPITGTAGGDCAIAKDGTAWFLIDVPLFTATAVFASSTVSATVFGTGSTSVIRFIGTGSTQAMTYITGVSASLNTASCSITVTAATATATLFSMAGTQTAISVSMAGTQTITIATVTFTATFVTFGR